MQGSMVAGELWEQQYAVQDEVAAVRDEKLEQKHAMWLVNQICTLWGREQPAETERLKLDRMRSIE